MKLFIVDDSEIMRDRLITMFSEIKDIEVVGYAEETLEAIKLIRDISPDIVILDIRIPGGSGIDVLENIKGKKNNSPIVIVLTNYAYPQYKERCIKLGAEYFFDKSTEFNDVYEVIQLLVKYKSK